MRRSPSVAFAAFALLSLASSSAAAASDSGADFDPGKALRRSDFAFGASLAGGFGTASGDPNDVSKLGDERYYASSGPGGGPPTTPWPRGAPGGLARFGGGP